ncbi:unnamed protein product, partial [Sphacelaria rigidula]
LGSRESQLQRHSTLCDMKMLTRRGDGLSRPERKRDARRHTREKTLQYRYNLHRQTHMTREVGARIPHSPNRNGSTLPLIWKTQLRRNVFVRKLHWHFIRRPMRRLSHLTPRLRKRRRPGRLKRQTPASTTPSQHTKSLANL